MKIAKILGALSVCLVLMAAVTFGVGFYIKITQETAEWRQKADLLQDEMENKTQEIEELQRQREELTQALQALQNPSGSPARHGWLSVQGGTLVDENGQAMQLRGASSHGIMWYPQYGNARALQSLQQAGANLFRIAMYTTENSGYDENPEEAKQMLRMTLENVLAANMYAIVDWHILKDQDPNVYVNEAVAFFDEISALYANEPGVIYEICNEPNGDTSWEDICRYAEVVIPVIRSNSPNAVILVGTPDYSTGIDKAIQAPLDFDNVMYTFHFYADQSGGGYEKQIGDALEAGIGVFVSEWGIGSNYNADSFGELAEKCSDFLDYLDENNISWAAWALSNKAEGHSMLRPETSAWSRWSQDELTNYGKFVFDRLRNGGGA